MDNIVANRLWTEPVDDAADRARRIAEAGFQSRTLVRAIFYSLVPKRDTEGMYD